MKRTEISALGVRILALGILVCGAGPSVARAEGAAFSTELIDQIQHIETSIKFEIPRLPESAQIVTTAEIDSIIANAEVLTTEQFSVLMKDAEETIAIRQQHQGNEWWETIQARQRHQTLQRWGTLSGEDRSTLSQSFSIRTQANVAKSLGKYREAETLYKRCIEILERTLGRDDPGTAEGLYNLAMLYLAQAQYAQAEPLMQRALAIFEWTLGPHHPDTANSLLGLAELYRAQDHYSRAEPLMQRALAIYERAQGPDHPNTAASLNNLGMLYHSKGQYAQAEPLVQRALAIFERTLGPYQPDTTATLKNLAALYYAQGQYAQAEPLFTRALAIYERTLGPHHSDTAASLNNLAMLYEAQGQYAQAEPLFTRALAIYERTLGPHHSDTAASLNNLAMLYEAQGQYAQAESLSRRALAIREQTLGSDHSHTAASLNNLAMLYEAQGRYAQAEPLLQRALAICERRLGPDHPNTAASLNSLALLYQAQSQYAQAEPLLQRALAIYERRLGPQHPDTANSLLGLAELYRAQAHYSRAESLMQRALAIYERAQGPDHPNTAVSLNNLALLYQAQSQYAQAEPLLQRALAISERRLGPDHPNTALALENLAFNRMVRQPDEATAQLLLRASQAKWQYLTRTFPTLPMRAQQQFLKKSGVPITPQFFWHLFAEVPTVDRGAGLQATLLSRQLVAEAARQESSAMRQVLADAAPAWRMLWQERDGLRRQYATLALQTSSDRALQPRPKDGPPAGAAQVIRRVSKRLRELEAQLRQENPAYARLAQLDQISVTQVTSSLQATQALLEYVQFQPYDTHTKTLAGPLHYGVYVVRGDQAPVVAVDLGEAAPIDTAIQQFHTDLRKIIDQVIGGMTPSPAQFRKSEAALAQWSSQLRTLIWQPLAPHLRGITRVYVAPEGQLSLLPFEVLAHKTKKQEWRYLVEDTELVYLNTGRDLARLALTAESHQPASANHAVLIGNPTFDLRPADVAKVIAALPTSAPTVVTHLEPGGGRPTLGATPTSQTQRLQVPRDWHPVPALGQFLEQAKGQLSRAKWSVTTLQEKQAVEEAVLRVQAPRLLQLATHGYLLEHVGSETHSWDNPLLRSMLLFSGVNQADPTQTVFYRVGQELLTPAQADQRGLTPEIQQQSRVEIGDGVLTAYEVTGMNLQGTELVNLTACETGLGQVTPDGVAGLRQAFLLAGARSLTTSLWEVPAEETTAQMAAFYHRWLGAETGKQHRQSHKAETRYAAFRQTQLAALAKTREEWNGAGHPFFWAGTIFLGDPGDLPHVRTGTQDAATVHITP